MLDCDGAPMTKEYLACILGIASLLFFKSLNTSINIQRMVVLSGIGGTGKSTLVG
jgi:excinuclease UvrABC ATPase subunit